MKVLTFAALAMAASLGACAVAPENLNRRINLTWKLLPENVERSKRTVESGDIIMSWAASAHATHEMVTSSGAAPLVAARTAYGDVYCGKDSCYEDRDANGALDYQWSILRNSQSPGQVQAITRPQEMKQSISFRAIDSGGSPVFEHLLGLVYNGPLQGVPTADQTLSPMLGELAVGWHAGVNAPRTPDGAGWSVAQILPLVIADGVSADTSVMPLGLTYRATKATIDGMLELEFHATPVDDVKLDAKPKFKLLEAPAATPPVPPAPQT